MKEPDWSKVPAVELKHQPWLEPCEVKAWAQLCYNEDTLFVRMITEETEIRAILTEPLSPVCCDSCLEFFLAPEADDVRYFNFEWNPLGTVYFGFGGSRETRIRQVPDDVEAVFHQRTFRTEKGWGIEYQVPAELIRRYFPDFSLSGEMAGNFYKCGDQTVHPHYLAWNDLTSNHPDFHRRQDFGRLILE